MPSISYFKHICNSIFVEHLTCALTLRNVPVIFHHTILRSLAIDLHVTWLLFLFLFFPFFLFFSLFFSFFGYILFSCLFGLLYISLKTNEIAVNMDTVSDAFIIFNTLIRLPFTHRTMKCIHVHMFTLKMCKLISHGQNILTGSLHLSFQKWGWQL